jgi:hypothetical protein
MPSRKYWTIYRGLKNRYPEAGTYNLRMMTSYELTKNRPVQQLNRRQRLYRSLGRRSKAEIRESEREERRRNPEPEVNVSLSPMITRAEREERRRNPEPEVELTRLDLLPRNVIISVDKIEFRKEIVVDDKVFKETKIDVQNNDYIRVLEEVKPKIREIVLPEVERTPIKLTYVLKAKFKSYNTNQVFDVYVNPFDTKKAPIISNVEEINKTIDSSIEQLSYSIENVILRGSDAVIEIIDFIIVKTAAYNPIGSSYMELPEAIKNTKACINIKNEDDKCALWACYAGLYPQGKNAERVSKYIKYDNGEATKIKTEGITFPLQVKDVPKLEAQNNFAINVIKIGEKKGECCQEYISGKYKNDQTVKIINLGRIEKGDKQHYVFIKKLSSLLNKRFNGEAHICYICLNYFETENALKRHFENCKINDPSNVMMPKGEKEITVKFKNYNNKLKCPFVVYADTEAVLLKKETYDEHQICSYVMVVVSEYEELIKEYEKILNKKYKLRPGHIRVLENMIVYLYRGLDTDDTQKQFFVDIQEIQWSILDSMKLNVPMNELTKEEKLKHKESKICHICEGNIEDEENKVRDHDHYSGKYRGAAHYTCNINYNFKNYKIPVFFHNLKGYDEHFIITAYSKYGNYYKIIRDKKTKKPINGEDGKPLKKKQEMRLECIPNSTEKYLTFRIGDLQFKDSYGFMTASLETLASNLVKAKGEEGFKYTKQVFSKLYDDKWKMLLRKGVYPYEYMDGFNKFNDKQLPPIESFFSKLKNDGIKTEDYEYAQKVWEEMNVKNMGEYTDLYMLLDGCLLADIFEEFRKMVINDHKLDPVNYLTAPSLFNDILYYSTKKEVKNIKDIDKLLMFEKAKRGGNCTTGADRYVRANNKYMKEYDNTIPSTFIYYIDANGLYSGCMTKPLPYGGYKWEKEIDKFTEEYIKNIPEEGIMINKKYRGYLFEIDGYYPNEVHDYLNDYTPLPENIANEASEYMKEAAKEMEIKSKPEVKLMCGLTPKNKYVVHYAELKSAIRHGFKLTKVHRVISFLQDRWMKPYIMENQNKRMNAINDFEREYYKLANNSVYGKTMENVRNRRDVKLTTNDKIKQKLANSPWYKNYKLLVSNKVDGKENGLFAIEMDKKNVIMNKPIAVGIAVLAWSKAIMYDMYYDVVKKKYGDKVRMRYTDTDSMFLSIKTEDLYKDIAEDLEFAKYFDFKKYSDEHALFNKFGNKEELLKIKKENKDVFGKFKDEAEGKQIRECCFIRSKMYSYKKDNEDEVQRLKGITKVAMKDINHKRYKDCLLSKEKEDRLQEATYYRIESKNHQLRTSQQTKTSLSHFDDKRYYLNAIESRAHGHFKNTTTK